MNDETQKLHEILQRATAAGSPNAAVSGGAVSGGEPSGDAELDAETASLREMWLAWGRLLEAHALDVPMPVGDEPRRTTFSRRKALSRHARLRIALSAAVAASLLIGAVAIWKWGPWTQGPDENPAMAHETVNQDKAKKSDDHTQDDRKQNGRKQAVERGTSPAVAETEHRAERDTASIASDDPLDSLSVWDDALDAEITSTAEYLAGVQRRWQPGSVEISMVGDKLNQLEQDLEDDSL